MDGVELILCAVFMLLLLGFFLSMLVRLLAWRKKCRPSRRFLLMNLLPGLILAAAVTAAYSAAAWRIMAEEGAQPVRTAAGQVAGLESQRIPGRYSTLRMYYIRLEGDPNRYHALFLERRAEEFLAAAGEGPVILWYTGEGRTREARAVQLADGTFFQTMAQSGEHDAERVWAGVWVGSALLLSLSALALGRPPKEWSRSEEERRRQRMGMRSLVRLLLAAAAAVIALFVVTAAVLTPVTSPVFYPVLR